MEFVAVAKTGVHIYDATRFIEPKDGGHADYKDNVADAADYKFEPSHSLPPSSGPAGFAYSADGRKLATVDTSAGGPAVIWDATKNYERKVTIEAVGASGGVRAVRFSPLAKFLVTHEKHDKEKCPENVFVWDLRGKVPERLCTNTLRGYASGKVPFDIYQWTVDDKMCLELAPHKGGVLLLDSDLDPTDKVIPEPRVAQVQVSPLSAGTAHVCVYVPETSKSSQAGYAAVYALADVTKPTIKVTLPIKLNGVTMLWNKEGTAVLFMANSDVDPTGQSYFGTTSLFLISADGKTHKQITGPEDGLVQDVAWSPNVERDDEFLVIVGSLPAKISLYDGTTGKLTQTLGTSRRNTIKWNPHGRFFIAGGFGALPGDIDIFDNVGKETLCSFRGNIPVDTSWAPDGRHFLTCTTCPRMNEDNQVYIYGYTGNQVVYLPFSPKKGAAGGRQAADVGAMLFAAAWRPDGDKKFKDRAASRGRGPRRIPNVLPSEGEDKGGAAKPKTYVAGGGAGAGDIAAMMRGEAPIQSSNGWGNDGGKGGAGFNSTPGEAPVVQLTWEEVEANKKERLKAKKDEIKATENAKLQALADAKQRDKKSEGAEKKLEKLKAKLEGLAGLKEKEWDELTEEDEEQLEGELDLIAEIKELEEKVNNL